MTSTWAWLAVLAAAQESPRVSIDRTATAEAHFAEVQRATGGKIKVFLEPPRKEFPLKLTEASFFEALDGVCRAHGSVSYFGATFSGPDGTIDVHADPWVEYPVQYSGPFRIMISELSRVTQASSLGNRGWSRVHMVLFAPPWISVGRESGAKAEFIPEVAQDAQGRDLMATLEERSPVQRVSVADYASVGTRSPSNSANQAVWVRPFDLDRGLALFKGHVALTVAQGVDTPLAPKEGVSVQIPAGTLVIDHVAEHLKNEKGIVWRLQLTLKPEGNSQPLRSLLENRVREGDGDWRELDLPAKGMTFEAVIGPLPQLPATLLFRARKGLQPIDVPFEFKNVSFKKG